MYHNYNKTFLGLEDIFVKKVTEADFFIKVFIETKPSPHLCPCCGSSITRIHDYRFQTISDIPYRGKKVFLVLKKRRYLCSCGKRVPEQYSFLPKYHRRTKRLSFFALEQLRETISLKQAVKQTGLSVQILSRLLDTVNYEAPDSLPQAISIDEFKGNAATGKYQCILVDPKKHRILDILPDRTQSHLADYWKNIPRHQRLKVKYFICDMWRPYADLASIYFPNASILIDKYHFIRQVTWAIENVRKRLQKSMPASLRKYYKRSRKLILTRYNKLKDENKQACDLMLQYSDDLRLAHSMKEWFYNICQKKEYRMQQKEFDDWIANARDCGIKEFEKCAQTYQSVIPHFIWS